MFSSILQSIIGLIVFILISCFFSNNIREINWKNQIKIFFVLLFMALFFLKVPWGILIIEKIAGFFSFLYNSSEKGIEFLFGNLSNQNGPWGFIFIFKVIPIIIFFSALIAALNYLGFIQKAVSGIGKMLNPFMGTKKAETLCAVANSFLGQTEAPILIKDYLPNMNDSEIFSVMVAGMGTISGGLIAVYGFLGVPIKHLLISSILSIPGTLFISKLWIPDTSQKKDDKIAIKRETKGTNLLDAISLGTVEGLSLAMNIAAILLVTISLLGLIDSLLFYISNIICFIYFKISGNPCETFITLKKIFSFLGIPFAWLIGFSNDMLHTAGSLIGTKIAVNEMVAFNNMFDYNFTIKELILLTYALCGFSNFSCIGIQIGGIGILAPEKRSVIAKLGFKAVFAAAISNLFIASLVNIILSI